MAFSDIKSSRKAKVVAAAVVAVVAIVVIALSAVSCSNESAADAIGADKAIARAIESANDNIEGANHEEAAPEDAGALNEGAEGVRSGDDEASAAEAQHAEESAKPENRKTAKPTEDAGTTSPSSPQPTPEPAKKWVEDTERIWVEDRAAWTEQVPVYGTKEVSICNVCGADITGNASSHGKAHMLAGEGSGHHSEVRQEITGYDTVSHPAEGHYETKVVGGHWE